MPYKEIPLSQLRLDSENSRHQILANDREAIIWILENPGKSKFSPLMKDIAENGLDPSMLPLVIDSGDDGYVVIEGNRRIAALKLLSNPDFTTNKKYQQRIKQIIREVGSFRPPKKILCVVERSRGNCDLTLERRHQGEQKGIGTVTWGAMEKERHYQRRGKGGRNADALEALEKAVAAGKLDEQEIESFPNLTTLTRVMKSKPFQNISGIKTTDGQMQYTIKHREANKPLFKLIKDLAEGIIKVDDVKTSKKTGEYLQSLDPIHVPSTYTPLKKPEPFSSTSPQPHVRRKSSTSNQRRALVPTNFKPPIDNPKVKAILGELKGIPRNRYPNATAVLFRVFIEFSLPSITFPKKCDSLAKKVRWFAQKLVDSEYISENEAQPVLEDANNKHGFLSIRSFNGYVHNRHFQPTSDDLRRKWDNFEPFLKAAWDYANDQES